MSQIKPKAKINLLTGIATSMVFFGAAATLQFHFFYGYIELHKYLVPLSIAVIVGWLLTSRYNSVVEVQQQLEKQNDFLRFVLDGAQAGVWDWNPQTGELSFDERWCNMLGYSKYELEPSLETWKSRVHPDDLHEAYSDINEHLKGNTEFYSNVHRLRHRDGHWVYILDQGRVLERDTQGQAIRFSGTHTDISHLKEVERQLEFSNKKLHELSFQDGLTGLKNRRAMDDFINQQWGHWQRNKTPFSVLMIDIDFFKQYNDFYGHLSGDNCLKAIAEVLKNITKRPNDIAVRYGGEEFLVIFSGLDLEHGLQMAEQIRQDVEALKIEHEASECAEVVTISVGICSCDVDIECASFLEPIDIADHYLYLAKNRGRNQVVSCKNPTESTS